MRRWLCFLLCLAVLGASSFAALADDMGLTSADVDAPVGLADDFGDTGLTLDDGSEEETVPEEVEVVLGADGEPVYDGTLIYSEDGDEESTFSDAGMDNDAAAEGFINRTLYGGGSGNRVMLRAAYANVGARLTGKEGRLYTLLREQIVRVASGEISSTVFYFNVSDIYDEVSFTAEDLGVEALLEEDGTLREDAKKAFWKAIAPNTAVVLSALLVDCPYDLYWFDKTGEKSGGSGFGMSRTYEPCICDGETIRLNMNGQVRYRFCVAQEYSATNATKTTDVNTSLPQAAAAAAANARTIVGRYEGLDDLAKLSAYRQEICGLVSYNHSAVVDHWVYGNPWQLVWVFDGDDSTDVVCEGYSKAFQYLCELSEFEDANLRTVSVTGTMTNKDGRGDKHMWNIVAMGGKNYMADLTNCDEGSVGYPDKLFLKGYSDKEVSSTETRYCFSQGSRPVYYVFDNNMYNLFQEEEIDYSNDPTGADTGAIQSGTLGNLEWKLSADGVLYISGAGAIPDFTDENPAPWGTEVKTATLAEGVTGIGAYAFKGCANLRWVKIPSSVETFSESAFEGCTKLTGDSSASLVVPCTSEAACQWASEHVPGCTMLHGATEVLPATAPTCVRSGLGQGSRCTVCGRTVKAQAVIPATGHTPVEDAAVAPTCTGTGLTAGSHCKTCGEVIVAQETVAATGHAPKTVDGTPATCTKAGLTEGTQCATCGEWITPQETISATGHTPVEDAAVAPTCTGTGLTAGSHCKTCGEVIVAQETVAATGHAPKTVNGTPATCTASGLTDGSECSVCHAILKAQQIIPAGHTPVTVKGRAATCTATGLTDGSKCSVCGEWITAQQTIEKKAHTPVTVKGRAATCTATGLTDGSKCSVCGVTLKAQQPIAEKAHTPVTVKGYAATHDRAGLTDGTKCGVCGTWITPQRTIAKLEWPARVLDKVKNNGTVIVNMGEKVRLVPRFAADKGASVTAWKSAKVKFATVDGGGLVTAVAEGKSKITVTTNNKKVKATITVVVVDPYKPTAISINQGKTVTLTMGQRLRLGTTLSPSTARATPTWKSSKPKVAIVDASGNVVPVGEGKAKITVTTHNKKKATITVQVVDPYKPQGISINQGKTVTLKVGQTLRLGTTLNPTSARTALTWKSGKPAIATVDGSGLVRAVKKGKAKITVTTYNKKKATFTVVVTE